MTRLAYGFLRSHPETVEMVRRAVEVIQVWLYLMPKQLDYIARMTRLAPKDWGTVIGLVIVTMTMFFLVRAVAHRPATNTQAHS